MGEGIRGNEKGNKGQGTRNKSQCGKMYSEKENKGVGSRIMGQGQVKRKSIMETKQTRSVVILQTSQKKQIARQNLLFVAQ